MAVTFDNFKYSAMAATVFGCGIYYLYRRMKERSSNKYETEKETNIYMAFQYTPTEEYVTFTNAPEQALNFHWRCVELCRKHQQKGVLARALDVGCGVGRTTFELARHFDSVVGIDYSSAFIRRCVELKDTGTAAYHMYVEGDIINKKIATIHPDIDRTRVKFMVGDGCNLPELGEFGCVLAVNLLCRLPDPTLFITHLCTLIVSGGIVVMVSPYAWMEQYTPKDKWIGGFKDKAGNRVRGSHTLKQMMEEHFKLIEEEEMPFIIREDERTYELTMSHAAVWRKC